MLKNIPKSNVSNRQLKVYKRFAATHADYPVLKIYDKSYVYHTGSGQFDSSTFARTIGVYINELYDKIPM